MRFILFVLGTMLLGLSGCAPTVVGTHDPVFFPPAPDPPRVQFLLGIGNSRDVAGNAVETSLFSYNSAPVNKLKSFVKPYGIATYKNHIFISDTMQSQVAVIDLVEKRFEWLKGNFGPGKLLKPLHLITDDMGYLYVADIGLNKVLAYDPAGNFIKTYGKNYNIQPVGVAVDDRFLYVLDKSRRKILIFNKETDELIEGLGQGNDNPMENLGFSTSMTLTKKGIFHVVDMGNGRIVSIDRDGHFLNALGKMGDGFGQFARPKGIDTDAKGRLYIVDTSNKNVQIFNEEGSLLMFFGRPGLPAGSLKIPAGIAVTDQNLDFYQHLAAPGFELEQVIMVVNQAGRYKINIYGLGKMQGIDYEAYYRKTLEQRRKTAAEKLDKKK